MRARMHRAHAVRARYRSLDFVLHVTMIVQSSLLHALYLFLKLILYVVLRMVLRAILRLHICFLNDAVAFMLFCWLIHHVSRLKKHAIIIPLYRSDHRIGRKILCFQIFILH